MTVGHRRPGQRYEYHCYGPGAAKYSSATAMSHALEELVGQFDLVQRSLLLTYVGLEQGPISFIYGPYPPRASSDQTDVFIAKDAVLESNYRLRLGSRGEIRTR